MTDVIIKNNEPVTDSITISNGTNNSHASVQKLIKNHFDSIKEFGVIGFEIRKPTTKNGGRPQEIYYLNESQTTFLLTLMRNSDEVTSFKKKLVKEFYRMKNTLIELKVRQQNKQWIEQRNTTKLTRKNETDSIKEFVKYAESQGSKNYGQYYSNITRMENQALFILEQKFDNVRDLLNNQQLSVISAADQIVEKALKDGMEQNMYYKDIFKMAKERVEIFASVLPKTPVIMLDEIKLISNDEE